MQLSIILVNYNVKYFLEQCLCSVHKAIEDIEAEVWVVDNASSDNSIEYLAPRFPRVKFIANHKNLGFAKANNLALFKCRGKHVLFLNPDTLIPEDSLAKCIAFMETNKQADALGIRMIDGSGTFLPESKRSFPSPITSFYQLAGMGRLFPASKVFSRYSLTYLDEFKNHEVDILSGAFMLVKKSVLIELKGFDEDFFMYGEDIDLSYRIQKLGYKNYYFGSSTIIHFKGESTRRKNLRYIRIFYHAMSIFVKKHYARSFAYLFSFFIYSAMWCRAGLSAALQFASETKRFLFYAGHIAPRNKKDNEKSEKQHLTIIAGTEEEYQEVKNLLFKVGAEKKIIGRVSTNERKENALGNMAQLNHLVESFKVKEIIFCQGNSGYSSIIDKIQNLPKKMAVRFHARGTESIVGSDSKDAAGEVVYSSSDM